MEKKLKRVQLKKNSPRRQFDVSRRLPGVVEPDNVGVLEALEHLGLFPEPLPLGLGPLLLLKLKKIELEN